MRDELLRNINTEIEMLKEISNYVQMAEHSTEYERRLFAGAINSLNRGMKIINSSVPKLVNEIDLTKKLPSSTKPRKKVMKLENIKIKRAGSDVDVTLHVDDREKFLRELSISEKFIRKLKKAKPEDKEEYYEFKGARGYIKLANKFFLDTASRLVHQGKFKSLSVSIKKANVEVLFESYVAMILFSVMISAIFSVLLMTVLVFVKVEFLLPFFSFHDGGYLLRLAKLIWLPFAIPILTFLTLYYYPSTERGTIENRIDQELPFAVIHMSSISGSGIPPSEVFKIIGLNKEYPYLRKEVRKILNQINLYGYDLVTALINTAKTSPSKKLSELLSGLATSITSGASLSEFFEKRAESLLLSYRLEREKYTRLVETFLDIYISVVIAAPMIFLLLLIMMAISGFEVGMTSVQISILAVLSIAVLNVLFMVFLHIKQPSY